MRKVCFLILTGLLALGCKAQFSQHSATTSLKAPDYVKGKFTDDYGIKYEISDSVFIQFPNTRFHIIRWNYEKQYLVARNDENNPTDPGLYTRIDYMKFSNMEPFLWGFCLSEYKAKSDAAAEAVAVADRNNPKKGCNGYPFSRMKKRVE